MTIYFNTFDELPKIKKQQFEETRVVQEIAALEMLRHILQTRNNEIVLGDDRGV
tara:strand:- start:392 stop:553 length:162 start_codon:yes stop_codon:yes gene_type:complete